MHTFTKQLDDKTPIPLYFQLKSILLDDIKEGSFKEGEAIPTEKELIAYYHISRSTVRQAISELVNEGWLTRKASKGTFVQKPQEAPSYIRSFEPFYQQITRLGKTPRTELINLEIIDPPEEIAQKMNLEKGEKVISMFRRRFADDIPMVTLMNYIPYDLCPFILEYDFTTNSLYNVFMEHRETQIQNTKTIVSALNPTGEDIHLLNIKPTTPMLCFNNISTTDNGTVIDFAYAHYRGDLNKFEINDSPHKTLPTEQRD